MHETNTTRKNERRTTHSKHSSTRYSPPTMMARQSTTQQRQQQQQAPAADITCMTDDMLDTIDLISQLFDRRPATPGKPNSHSTYRVTARTAHSSSSLRGAMSHIDTSRLSPFFTQFLTFYARIDAAVMFHVKAQENLHLPLEIAIYTAAAAHHDCSGQPPLIYT